MNFKSKRYHAERCLNGGRFITWTSLFMNTDGYFIFRFEQQNAAQIAAVVKNQTQDTFVEAFETYDVTGNTRRQSKHLYT